LLREDPHLSVRGGELTDPRGIGQGEAHVHERPVAVDEHASLCVARLRVRTGAHDEEAGIRGLGLFRDGKDCLARLLSIPDRGLDRDLEAELLDAPMERRQDLQIIKGLVYNYSQRQSMYQCEKCGFKARSFFWHCPACGSWDSFPPQKREE